MKARPLVFIGSSTEGLPIAKAIQAELRYSAECVIWSQGVFGLNEGPLDALVRALETFDFAILVLTPDDLVASRGAQHSAPRDNVLLELGMFIGGLGRSRTFIVVDESARVKLPSDLAGIVPATFQPPSAGTMQSALGPACTAIEQTIARQGKRSGEFPVAISGSWFRTAANDQGVTFTITNVGAGPLPPFKVALFHPKLGTYFMFPSGKSGQLLSDQRREYSCLVIANGRILDMLPAMTHDPNGELLIPEDDAGFEFRLILEESDNKVLYTSRRIGRGLATILRRAVKDGTTIQASTQEWSDLSNALPDE